MGKKADAKNKDEDEKIGENEFNFSILYIKLGYMAIFMKICPKKNLTYFVGHFWLIKAKMKMKMKKCGKMSPIFEFSISKKVMWQFSWESYGKFFDLLLKTFLTNQGKNEDEEEKNWKNEFDF